MKVHRGTDNGVVVTLSHSEFMHLLIALDHAQNWEHSEAYKEDVPNDAARRGNIEHTMVLVNALEKFQ